MYELLKKSNKTLKNKFKKFLTKTSEYDKIKKLCHKKEQLLLKEIEEESKMASKKKLKKLEKSS